MQLGHCAIIIVRAYTYAILQLVVLQQHVVAMIVMLKASEVQPARFQPARIVSVAILWITLLALVEPSSQRLLVAGQTRRLKTRRWPKAQSQLDLVMSDLQNDRENINASGRLLSTQYSVQSKDTNMNSRLHYDAQNRPLYNDEYSDSQYSFNPTVNKKTDILVELRFKVMEARDEIKRLERLPIFLPEVVRCSHTVLYLIVGANAIIGTIIYWLTCYKTRKGSVPPTSHREKVVSVGHTHLHFQTKSHNQSKRTIGKLV